MSLVCDLVNSAEGGGNLANTHLLISVWHMKNFVIKSYICSSSLDTECARDQ